jgi:enediyne polyketide synthase
VTQARSNAAAEYTLSWQAQGKPALQGDDASAPHISISHDDDLCLVGIGAAVQGCDIETLTARDHATWVGLLGANFEPLLLELLRDEALDLAGTRIWAAKEALIKALEAPCTQLQVLRRQDSAVLFNGQAGERVLGVLTYPLELSAGPRRMLATVVENDVEAGDAPTSSMSSQRVAKPEPALPAPVEIPAALAHLYPDGRVNPFEIGVETSGPIGQPLFRYRFPLTFSDCTDIGRGAYFARYLAWMGQIRELSVAAILPELKALFASGKWGSVTNGWETFHYDEANQEDLVEGRFYATRRHGRFDAAFDLITEWTAIDRQQRARPLALTFMTASWVEVVGHAEVRLAPMPDFFDKYMRLMVTSVGQPGRGIVDPAARPALDTAWGECSKTHARGEQGWPLVHQASFQTGLDHGNLVGNVYYSNYPRWAGCVRDVYFFKLAPELYRGADYSAEFLCRRMKVDHLREAMPFDRVVVEMSVKAVYRCGAALVFQYFRSNDDGTSTKLAVAEQDVIFARREHGNVEPRPLPDAIARALRLD